ncbi:hypothetical protein VTH06DRAFT_7307 [Thermothelomyces fergusii]
MAPEFQVHSYNLLPPPPPTTINSLSTAPGSPQGIKQHRDQNDSISIGQKPPIQKSTCNSEENWISQPLITIPHNQLSPHSNEKPPATRSQAQTTLIQSKRHRLPLNPP